jgi:hypothetical protein
MTPNGRLLRDVYASALRASFSAKTGTLGLMLRTVLMLVVTALVSPNAFAQSLCAHVKPDRTSEGAMPIPEKAFTEQAAKRELQKLQSLLGPDGLAVDPPVWETSFVYLEGWFLKRQALEAKNGAGPALAITDFCAFMKDKAYVRH